MDDEEYDLPYKELVAEFPEMLGSCRVEYPPGWHEPIRTGCRTLWALYLELKEHFDEPISIAQIKEKFGGCRFYLDGVPLTEACKADKALAESLYDRFWQLATEIENAAGKHCQSCGGEPARIVSHRTGWLSCLCQRCQTDSHTEVTYDETDE
jgi:hypothetical protein